MTSTDRKPVTDKINPHTGKVYWATPKRANTHEDRPVKVCPDCQHEVAFIKSPKTGKWYLCDVHTMDAVHTDPKTGLITPLFQYWTDRPHFQTCRIYQERLND